MCEFVGIGRHNTPCITIKSPNLPYFILFFQIYHKNKYYLTKGRLSQVHVAQDLDH